MEIAIHVMLAFITIIGINNKYDDQELVEKLISDSKEGLTLIMSDSFRNEKLTRQEVDQALKYIAANPDLSSCHLMFSIRKDHPEEYKRISFSNKASVLISMLESGGDYNDWGHLNPDGYSENDAAKALLELGKGLVPYLVPVLADKSPATLGGSEARTISIKLKYRRADFAHRYITKILELPYAFRRDVVERDKDIGALKESLKKLKLQGKEK